MQRRWVLAIVSAIIALVIALPAVAEPKKAAKPRPSGAVVVSVDDSARGHARTLARLIYQDTRLRPRIDEHDAQVLAGNPPPASDAGDDGKPVDDNAVRRAELATVIKTLAVVDRTVQRRLLAAAGAELGVELVLLVSSGAQGPTAQVLRVSEARFLSVTLAPKKVEPKGAPTGEEEAPAPQPSWDWSDAVGMLRGLLSRPPPGPRPKPAVKHNGKAILDEDDKKADEDDDSVDLLTSPWFWGGLGVVVTVGVTVLVLSQTVFDESDTVVLEGQVSP